MDTPDKNIEKLGIVLPAPPRPIGSYVTSVRSGNLLFLSGMLPLVDGKLLRTGRVGKEISPEDAKEDARRAAINAISVLKESLGDLSRVKRCVKIVGYVASSKHFTGQPGVLNGASDLMVEVFGEAGRHVRVAVGVSVLPMGSPVEVEFIFEVD